MSPEISDGCFVLIHSWWKFLLSEKTTLCFHHDIYGQLVKIFVNKDHNGFYWFRSLNKKGLSTSEIGPVKEEKIIGRVLFKINILKCFYCFVKLSL